MKFEIHHTVHLEPHLEARLRLFNQTLGRIYERIDKMADELNALEAQVRHNSEVLGGAVTLINGIADRIKAAGTDPVKLAALTDELRAKDDELAAAVAANTPAAPAPA